MLSPTFWGHLNPEYGWRGFFMSKYTKELKIKLVLEYLSGESGGQDKITNNHSLH